jgi:isoleucyl-tRNA synthetase
MVQYVQMEELDKWALDRLYAMNERVRKAYEDFEFHVVYHTLHNFCVIDLSSFYLDIIKDRLYVSSKKSRIRRSAQTAMYEILNSLVRLMAPVLSFTADEIWQFMNDSGKYSSVHADLFKELDANYKNPEIAEKWEEIIRLRKEVTKALELARKDKLIGHSLDASITLGISKETMNRLDPFSEQLRAIFIVSSVHVVPFQSLDEGYESEEINQLRIKVAPSDEEKCERCWVHDSTVGEAEEHPTICKRCLDALSEMEPVSA